MTTIDLTDLPDGYVIGPDGRVFVVSRSTDAGGRVVRVHRRVIDPDDPIGAESREVKEVVRAARTPERLALHEVRKARRP